MKTNDLITKNDVDTALADNVASSGLGILGLEEEDISILPVPFVRVVQGQSKDVQTKDGNEAPEGYFFFNDTREAFKDLTFVILKSKIVKTEFERNGERTLVSQRKILGITMDTKKLFVLSISVGSFNNYGRLIAELKQKQVKAVWDFMVTAITRKTENEKGKFYVVEFNLGEALNDDDKKEMAVSFGQYCQILETKSDNPLPWENEKT